MKAAEMKSRLKNRTTDDIAQALLKLTTEITFGPTKIMIRLMRKELESRKK